MILRIIEEPAGFRVIHYQKETGQHWAVLTGTRAEADAVADKLTQRVPAPPRVLGDAVHAREARYLVSSLSRGACHYVAEGSLGPPFKSVCGRDLGPVTLHPETEAEVTCPSCRVVRRERIEWTAPR